MYVCTTADLGPDFIAWAGVIDERPVAVVTPRAKTDSTIAGQAAELLRRMEFPCSGCADSCPIGLSHGED